MLLINTNPTLEYCKWEVLQDVTFCMKYEIKIMKLVVFQLQGWEFISLPCTAKHDITIQNFSMCICMGVVCVCVCVCVLEMCDMQNFHITIQ